MATNIHKYIDLHTHTYHSDGVLSPTQLVEKAKEAGLSAIAITDHDSINGIEEGLVVGKKLGVEVIPGVEITSFPDEKHEFHFLGYFINWQDRPLQKALEKSQKAREERAKKVVKNLNRLGYEINFGNLRALTRGTIVMPHIAWVVINDKNNRQKLIKEFGSMPSTGDIIEKYLVPGAPAYEARKTFGQKEAVDLIQSSGGVVVLAHPCWSLTEKQGTVLIHDDRKLNQVTKLGIDGLEALAHRDNKEDTEKCVKHYEKFAEENNLLITGGSDYHGFGSAGKDLGYVDFYLKVPYEILEKLKARHER